MNNPGYVYRVTLVATIGGLLFGYDTAVVSGAVKAIREFFVVPLMVDITLAEKVIAGYRITVCVAGLIVGVAVSGMLVRLFGWVRGLSISILLFIVATSVIIWRFRKPFMVTNDSSNAIVGFTVSSALIGCIVGGTVGGFLSTMVGRKKGLIIAAFLFLISGIGAGFPERMALPGMQPLVSFIFYRILGGLGIGIASMLSPMYIAEIAPAGIRGKLVSWNQFAIVLGILVVYFVNWFIASRGDETWNMTMGWRWMFLSGSIPSLVFICLLPFIPETPRYLVLRKRRAKALEVLRRTVGGNMAEQSLEEISTSLHTGSAPWLSFGGLLIILSILLAALQQFTGINIVLYYAPRIFQNTGTQLDVSLLQTVLVGAVNVLFTVIAIFTVDSFGRKPLLIMGSLIMGFAMTGIGFSFYNQSMGYPALVLILVHTAGFAMSWGPVMWVLLSEIFPNSIRGAMSIATATVWITDLIVSWSFPVLDGNTWLTSVFHHGFTYWIYAFICFVAVSVVWKMIPETKGITLENIEKFWKKT
jgi:SP family xylose:H+ symportor-like MFS transporter